MNPTEEKNLRRALRDMEEDLLAARAWAKQLKASLVSTWEMLLGVSTRHGSITAQSRPALELNAVISEEIVKRDYAIDGLVPIRQEDMELLIPLDDWVADTVPGGGVTDDDGHGYFANQQAHGHRRISPSDVYAGKWDPPHWATHILWYNK